MNIKYEKEMASSVFDERTRLYFLSVVNNLDLECSFCGLKETKNLLIIILMEYVLTQVMEWINGKIIFHDIDQTVIIK